jgi:DNA-binding transcriptional LysR family regulator
MLNKGPPLELRLLRTFVTVAQERHYRRAAEKLNLTQSATSLQVSELERRLGATLLTRNRRGVSLTGVGELVYCEGLELLSKADLLAKNTLAAEQGRRGIVTIGTIAAATFEVLPRLIETARSTLPAVEFRFREMGGRDQLEALRRGDIDIGLVRSEARVPGLKFKTIHIEPVVCLVPAGHPLATKAEVSISELEGQSIVNLARDQDPAGHDFYVSLYRLAGFEPHVVQEVSQASTILFAVASLGCVSLGPASWRYLRRTGVEIVPVAHPAPTIATRLVWNEFSSKPAVVALLNAWSAERQNTYENVSLLFPNASSVARKTRGR